MRNTASPIGPALRRPATTARTIAWVAAIGLAAGCSAKRAGVVEPELPELQQEIPDVSPFTTLEAGAEVLEPSPRAVALGWLIRTSDANGGGEWTSRGLHDPSAWVQRAAVNALVSRLPEAASQTHLENYLSVSSADPYVRGNAGIQLAPLASPAAATALKAAWRAEQENWAIAPLALAAAAHDDAEAIDAVATAVKTAEFALELDFISDLGTSGHPALLEAVQQGAEYAEEEVQLPFAVALIQLGDPSGEQVLRKALAHADPEVRQEAIATLVGLDHPTATALLHKARGDRVALLSWHARLGLAARTGQDGQAFEQAFADADREVRALAVNLGARAYVHPVAGVSKRTRKGVEAVVLSGLSDNADTVRLPAVQAAAQMELRSAIPHLQPLLRDPWQQLRIEAAGTLLQLN